MKYPCDIIQDLLPLYFDGVCSEESKKAIEKHLSECFACKDFYTAMCEADKMEIDTYSADRERQKAASFQAVKKKLFRKQILAVFAAIGVLVVIAISAVGILKNTPKVVEYEDNITVSMVDGDLIGRLQGSRIFHVSIKRVTVTVEEQEENYIFFYMSDTKWDELITSSDVFSEYTLYLSDKGADQIDAVCYFTGDYTNIESKSSEELQEIINASVILWQKQVI